MAIINLMCHILHFIVVSLTYLLKNNTAKIIQVAAVHCRSYDGEDNLPSVVDGADASVRYTA